MVPVDCILATCEIVPALDPDDRAIVRELQRRGLSVLTAVWNDPLVRLGRSAPLHGAFDLGLSPSL